MEGRRVVGLLKENKLTIFLIDPENESIRKLATRKPRGFPHGSWSDQCICALNSAAKRHDCRADLSSLFDEAYIPKAFGSAWEKVALTAEACNLVSGFVIQVCLMTIVVLLILGIYKIGAGLALLMYLLFGIPCVHRFARKVEQLRRET